jgi:hypothetical protein
MLCESLFHLLVEEGVITKAKAMEAIEGVAELTREMAEAGNPSIASSIETDLIEAIAKSFALKDNPERAGAWDGTAASGALLGHLRGDLISTVVHATARGCICSESTAKISPQD